MLPSEIFARQVFTTREDEGVGVELIPRIGVDNVMWASDDPHGDSTWPNPRRALADSPLARHGSEVLRKVTCENAAFVRGLPASAHRAGRCAQRTGPASDCGRAGRRDNVGTREDLA